MTNNSNFMGGFATDSNPQRSAEQTGTKWHGKRESGITWIYHR